LWSKVNLILSHVNHTFFILDLWIGPQASRHTHCTLGTKRFFLMWRRVQFKVQFASNCSVDFWSLDPCLTGPLASCKLADQEGNQRKEYNTGKGCIFSLHIPKYI
jgi:hypothetical protein